MKFAHGEASPGDVIIVTNLLLFGAYFLGVMSPHIMSILKARVAAAVIYNRIDRVRLTNAQTFCMISYSSSQLSTLIPKKER